MKKSLLSILCAISVMTVFSENNLIPAYAETNENVPYEENTDEILLSGVLNPDSYLNDVHTILSNYNDNSYNYRDQLDTNNLAVYETLSQLTTPSTDKIVIDFPETISMEFVHRTSSKNFTSEEKALLDQTIAKNFIPGIDAVILDMPEIFWLEPQSLFAPTFGYSESFNFFTGKYVVNVKSIVLSPKPFESYSSLDEVNIHEEMLENVVDNFYVDENSTRYEQLKAIHDYICNFTYYDSESPFCFSSIGSLVQPGAVCESYSKGFKLICDKLDIPCVLAVGNYTENSGHMWNYVKMEDGKWYAVDVTWDDPDGQYGLEVRYEYFLRGSEYFNISHNPENDYNGSYIVYPEISENDYEVTENPTTTTTTTTTTKTTSSTTTSTTTKPTTTTTTTKKSTTTTTTTKKPTTTTTTTESPVKPALVGDLNHDGKVNIADLVYCANAVMGKETEYSCDFNGDGFTDSFDITLMRRILIG